MSGLQGKRALITGASQGIGAAICVGLAEQGARVVIHYNRNRAAAASLQAELDFAHPGCVDLVQADLCNPHEVEKMVREAREFLGGLDILVNNAGWESTCSAIDLSLEDWRRALDTNLTGSFLCSQHAARIMRSQGTGGVILNNSSIHESIPRLGLTHYCVSKAGLAMLTKSLALEWAEFGIRVVAISPGAIETEMNREEITAFGREKFEGWIPLSRLGTPMDVAAVSLFLVSDQASYITGVTLTVDGGYGLITIPYDPRTAEK